MTVTHCCVTNEIDITTRLCTFKGCDSILCKVITNMILYRGYKASGLPEQHYYSNGNNKGQNTLTANENTMATVKNKHVHRYYYIRPKIPQQRQIITN
jgi:hypothetical protein